MSALPNEGWLIAHPPPSHTPLFPLTKTAGYTADEWFRLPQTGERMELIDGSLVVQGVPAPHHATCAGRLVRVLLDAAPDDLEVAEAVGTLVGDDGLIPDVVVADAEVMTSGMQGISFPDVVAVAEVVSPGVGNKKRDYEIKPPKYAAAGIPTFIRVELEGDGAPWVEVFHLRGGRYELATVANAGEVLTLTQPFPVSFDPAILTGRRKP